jgi:hypothetical protein
MEIGQAAVVFVFLSGLFAGSLHVLSGPDHVAAIAPLTLRHPQAGSAFGAVWGLGHGGGVLLWLLVSSWLRQSFGVEPEPAALEAAVGCSLIALGAFSFFTPLHGSRREGRASTHMHTAGSGGGGHGHRHARPTGRVTAFALGALHGSAGASHLLALIPTLGLATSAAFVYGAGYLFAGVLAMASVGTVLGKLSVGWSDLTVFRRACAALVMALGVVWLLTALRDL